ncbi:MAG: SpoIID/LytB domain-containing protein [Acidobacteria bacterium]|nr:SpoIID/LytB domain-containing protein [Acidobacteriota bacterium]
MKNDRVVLTVLLAVLAPGCASHGVQRPTSPPAPPSRQTPSAPAAASPEQPSFDSKTPIRVEVVERGSRRVTTLDLDEYVVGCVVAEIGVYGLPEEAAARVLEMQALLCRTNAATNRGRHRHEGFDLCSGSHCQIYRAPADDAMTKRARRAVAATTGRVVVHEGRPIQALFHADCAGHTSAAETVWGGSEPYLRARTDVYCRRAHNPAWVFMMEGDRLRDALNRQPDTRVGPVLKDIRVVARDEAGRASRVELVGDRVATVRGAAFRWALLQAFGPRSLKSTRFEVGRHGDGFSFHGEGNGHGVGLCQTGALARARAGHRAEEILRFYYPGVEVS